MMNPICYVFVVVHSAKKKNKKRNEIFKWTKKEHGMRKKKNGQKKRWITNVIHTDNLWLLTLELIKSNRIRLMAERNGMENNNEANKSTLFFFLLSCRLRKKYSVQLRASQGGGGANEWANGEWHRAKKWKEVGARGWRRVERRLSVPKRSSFSSYFSFFFWWLLSANFQLWWIKYSYDALKYKGRASS